MKLKLGKKRGKRMTLNQLKVGNSAVITTVGGDGALRCRLLDMGLIPHTRVTLQKVAPMGDPIEIRVRGYELTLRVEEAQKIEVEDEPKRSLHSLEIRTAEKRLFSTPSPDPISMSATFPVSR